MTTTHSPASSGSYGADVKGARVLNPVAGASDKASDNALRQLQTERDALRHRRSSDLR
jgi:hypothetical protein